MSTVLDRVVKYWWRAAFFTHPLWLTLLAARVIQPRDLWDPWP